LLFTPTRLALDFISSFRPLDRALIRALPAESPNHDALQDALPHQDTTNPLLFVRYSATKALTKALTKAPTKAPMTTPATDGATGGATDGDTDGICACAYLRIASLAEICALVVVVPW
jgi:hypothetical protein